ncbi:uncharacterized protein SPPG_08746 [Spizellomyces punctatus DAOM BR117]|uniref:Succinate dehydrogenase [ubiquinone] cytochrome b small subunit n=1 Tax=Spizellomyces punctatus (strain DAOM BR117) TaxID=645134 RepID=A0A0L0H575_SPIPD|nr:hypothetical protein, variant [Spizellomyces punctatus DAOM BR117]XP_016603923.1 uncharacterized protein SPPG_08746 [Spizellomyces punctatus DAOM BR117]KNC95882.1 hypothetical protein, variant [Spizellomyces punctatus DAOM BR117]KNC95883.1 hypothetical protein SPPG_08746 [Spizellomyces punctatus DAOM BR117]|eukprot:XP_016603922.1 hypothetical protein, variant [Spizellomyces punctatus DAOM BR117]
MLTSRVICSAARVSSVVRPSALTIRANPVATFRSARPDLFQNTQADKRDAVVGAAAPENPGTTTQSGEHKSKLHGSYHWDFERALSIALVPLMTAPFIIGSHPYVDLGLGVVIPLHTHIGFDAVIEDYLPVRRNPIIHRVMKYSLYTATGLCLYGCYQFNTNDIGITEFVKRLWTGKQ